MAQNINEDSGSSNTKIKVLLITDDHYGSSFVYEDESIKSIKHQFEDFGWDLILTSLSDTIMPCDWGEQALGSKPIIISHKFLKIKEPSDFDATIILPGRSFSNLINNTDLLNFLKKANEEEMIIAAWCRVVSVLAAANIISGKNIIGHFDYFEEYKSTGANYIEYSFKLENGKKLFTNATPPIKDGNIITCIRSLYYRNEMCQLIKESIDQKRSPERP